MAKPEWGAKRQCPKCGTRFYDLGKDNPVTCISCGHSFQPEPILKSRRPREEAAAAPETKETPASTEKETAESGELEVEETVESETEEPVIGLEEAEEDDDVSGVINPQVDEDET